jgi:hypothetical protein
LIDQIFVNYSCRVNNFAILKELKKLEKIVADTQRELEPKKRELEREKLILHVCIEKIEKKLGLHFACMY